MEKTCPEIVRSKGHGRDDARHHSKQHLHTFWCRPHVPQA